MSVGGINWPGLHMPLFSWRALLAPSMTWRSSWGGSGPSGSGRRKRWASGGCNSCLPCAAAEVWRGTTTRVAAAAGSLPALLASAKLAHWRWFPPAPSGTLPSMSRWSSRSSESRQSWRHRCTPRCSAPHFAQGGGAALDVAWRLPASSLPIGVVAGLMRKPAQPPAPWLQVLASDKRLTTMEQQVRVQHCVCAG